MAVGKLPLTPGGMCACPAIAGVHASVHLAANSGNPVPGGPAITNGGGTPVISPTPLPALKPSDIGIDKFTGGLGKFINYPGRGQYPGYAGGSNLPDLFVLQAYDLAATQNTVTWNFVDKVGKDFELSTSRVVMRQKGHPLEGTVIGFALNRKFADGTRDTTIVSVAGDVLGQGSFPDLASIRSLVLSKISTIGYGGTATTYIESDYKTLGVANVPLTTPNWKITYAPTVGTKPLAKPIVFDEVMVNPSIMQDGTSVTYVLSHPVYGQIGRILDLQSTKNTGAVPRSYRIFMDDVSWSGTFFDVTNLSEAITQVVAWRNEFGIGDKTAPVMVKAAPIPVAPIAPPISPTPVSVAPSPAPAGPSAFRPLMENASVILGTKTGAATGSNKAGKSGFWTGTDGVKRYVKEYANPDQAIQEALAFRIYQALGIPVPDVVLAMDGKKLIIATTIVPNDGAARGSTQQEARTILEGYAADVLLLNYDVMGAGGNVAKGKDGKLYRIDAGGSLEFRARGNLKTGDLMNVMATFSSMLARNPGYGPLLVRANNGITSTGGDPLSYVGLDVQVLALRDTLRPNGATSVRPIIDAMLSSLDPSILPKGISAYVDRMTTLIDTRLDGMTKALKMAKTSSPGSATATGPISPTPTTPAGTPVVSGTRTISAPINGDRIRQKLLSMKSGYVLAHPNGGRIGMLTWGTDGGGATVYRIAIEGGPLLTSPSINTVKTLAAKWINQNGVLDAPGAASPEPVEKPKVVVDANHPIPDKWNPDALRQKTIEAKGEIHMIVVSEAVATDGDGNKIGMNMNAVAQGRVILTHRDGIEVAKAYYVKTKTGDKEFRKYSVEFADGTKMLITTPDTITVAGIKPTDAEIYWLKKAIIEKVKAIGGIPKDPTFLADQQAAAGLLESETHTVVLPRKPDTQDGTPLPEAPKPFGTDYKDQRLRTASTRRNGGTIVGYSTNERNEKRIVVKGNPKAAHPHRRQTFAEILSTDAPTTAITLNGTEVHGKALAKVRIDQHAPTLAEDIVILNGASAGITEVVEPTKPSKPANTVGTRLKSAWDAYTKIREPRYGITISDLSGQASVTNSFQFVDISASSDLVATNLPEVFAFREKFFAEYNAFFKAIKDIKFRAGVERVVEANSWSDTTPVRGVGDAATRTEVLTHLRAKRATVLDGTSDALALDKIIALHERLAKVAEQTSGLTDGLAAWKYEKTIYEELLAKIQEEVAKAKADPEYRSQEQFTPSTPSGSKGWTTDVATREDTLLKAIAPVIKTSIEQSKRTDDTLVPTIRYKSGVGQVPTEGKAPLGADTILEHNQASKVLREIFKATAVEYATIEVVSGKESKARVEKAPEIVRKIRADALRAYTDSRFTPGTEVYNRFYKLADVVERALRLDATDYMISSSVMNSVRRFDHFDATAFFDDTVSPEMRAEAMDALGKAIELVNSSTADPAGFVKAPSGRSGGTRLVNVLQTFELIGGRIEEVALAALNDAESMSTYDDRDVVAIRVTSDTDAAKLLTWGFIRGDGDFSDHFFVTRARAKEVLTQAFGSLTAQQGVRGKTQGSSTLASNITKKKAEPKVVSTRYRPLEALITVENGQVRTPRVSLHDLVLIMRDQTSTFSASLPNGGKVSTPAIDALWTLLGLMDPPAVVPADGFADLIGESTVVHMRGDKRGIYRDQLLGYPTDPKAQLGNGSRRFAGSGVYGDGQYSASFVVKNSKVGIENGIGIAWSATEGYTGSTKDYGRTGPKSLYLISENARAITTSNLKTVATALVKRLNAVADPDAREISRALERLLNNDNGYGLLALILGYDVLVAQQQGYSILINPTAAIYLEDNIGTAYTDQTTYGERTKKQKEMREWLSKLLSKWLLSTNTKKREGKQP